MCYASLSEGNMKLGSIPSVSFPPIKTCSPKLPCFAQCYARQAYKQYPNVRRAYDRNMTRARKNPKQFFGSIIWQIKKNNMPFFRWHVAGDIPFRGYVQGMIDVANALPEVKFLCFTKRYDWVAGIRFPKNLSVILSAWPGLALPRTCRPIAFMQDGTEDRAKGALTCPGGCSTCGMCWNLPGLKKNVVFPLHSGPIASAKARKERKEKAQAA